MPHQATAAADNQPLYHQTWEKYKEINKWTCGHVQNPEGSWRYLILVNFSGCWTSFLNAFDGLGIMGCGILKTHSLMFSCITLLKQMTSTTYPPQASMQFFTGLSPHSPAPLRRASRPTPIHPHGRCVRGRPWISSWSCDWAVFLLFLEMCCFTFEAFTSVFCLFFCWFCSFCLRLGCLCFLCWLLMVDVGCSMFWLYWVGSKRWRHHPRNIPRHERLKSFQVWEYDPFEGFGFRILVCLRGSLRGRWYRFLKMELERVVALYNVYLWLINRPPPPSKTQIEKNPPADCF